jgi:hypothetical protein
MAAGRAKDSLEALLEEIAAADAPELVAQARAAAQARARALIEEALVDELLRAAGRLVQPKPEPRRPEQAEVGDAWWTYCILSEADARAVSPKLEGIEPGSGVEVVAEGGLAALASQVPLAEYDDDRLREHLEDIEWVEQTARAHEAVLDRVLGDATIVPLRLCTIYRDLDGVRRLLRQRAEELFESLAAVDGCTEWGVKLFAEPGALQTAPVAEDEASSADAPEPPAEEPSGAQYLARRQRQRMLATQADELRTRCAEEIHRRLAEVARETRVNPLQRPELHGREEEMLLNAAYLVSRDRSKELQAAVERLREEWEGRGFLLELTGPWPPYNFVSGQAGMMA